MICALPERCGRPQDGPGHPHKGWLNVKIAGTSGSTWWCSPVCLVRGLARTHDVRLDVASCAACINRHARAHRCPACGNAPQINCAVVPAAHLYQRAHDSIAAGPQARP